MTGNGFQYIGQLAGTHSHAIALNTNYYYQATFYQLQYYRTLSRKRFFWIDLLAQPQYNITKYKVYQDDINYQHGYELGLNIGVILRKHTSDNLLSFYALVSTGPHYVSGTPQRQISGFIFSDNFDAGINLRIYKNLYADLRPGFRHISNGKLRFPNGGVNDLTLTEGFLVSF